MESSTLSSLSFSQQRTSTPRGSGGNHTGYSSTPFRLPPIQEPLALHGSGSRTTNSNSSGGFNHTVTSFNNEAIGGSSSTSNGRNPNPPMTTTPMNMTTTTTSNMHDNNDDDDHFASPDQYDPSTFQRQHYRHSTSSDNHNHIHTHAPMQLPSTLPPAQPMYGSIYPNFHAPTLKPIAETQNHSQNIIHPMMRATMTNPSPTIAGSVMQHQPQPLPAQLTTNRPRNSARAASITAKPHRKRNSLYYKVKSRTPSDLLYDIPEAKPKPNMTEMDYQAQRKFMNEVMRYYLSDGPATNDVPLPPRPTPHDAVAQPHFRRSMPSAAVSTQAHFARSLTRKSWIVPLQPPQPPQMTSTTTGSTSTDSHESTTGNSIKKRGKKNDESDHNGKADVPKRPKVSFSDKNPRTEQGSTPYHSKNRTIIPEIEDDVDENDNPTTPLALSSMTNSTAPASSDHSSSQNSTTSNNSSRIRTHEIEYVPPPMSIADVLDPVSTTFQDILNEICNATPSWRDASDATTYDDDDDDDTFQSCTHYNFPHELEPGMDSYRNDMVDTVVTDEEWQQDEKLRTEIIERELKKQETYIVYTTDEQEPPPEKTDNDEPNKGWGNSFAHFFENKWQCLKCRVYNENTQTVCASCDAPHTTNTVSDSSNPSGTTATSTAVAVSLPSTTTTKSPFLFSAAAPTTTSATTSIFATTTGAGTSTSTSVSGETTMTALTAPTIRFGVSAANPTTSTTTATPVSTTNITTGGFTFGANVATQDTKPATNPSFGVSTPTPFVFGTANNSTAATTNAAPVPPLTGAPGFTFGSNSVSAASTTTGRDTAAPSTSGTSVPSFSFSSSTPVPFSVVNPSITTVSNTAAPSTNGSSAPTFSFLSPTPVPVNDTTTNGPTFSNSIGAATSTDTTRPFVFGGTSAPVVPINFGTTVQPSAGSQSMLPKSTEANNQTTQSMPPPTAHHSIQPINNSSILATAPTASSFAPPATPLFGNAVALPPSTATMPAAPLFGNANAPQLFGSNTMNNIPPAPTGPFLFGNVPSQGSNAVVPPAATGFGPFSGASSTTTNHAFNQSNLTFGNPSNSNTAAGSTGTSFQPPLSNGGFTNMNSFQSQPPTSTGQQGGFQIGTSGRRIVKARRPK